ncbi:MAG TPA: glutamine-synthetase adenylyltransferase, partial [Stellaceae bacterium]|nr:glutamine-synthetase adenylyltransferase [Stellaceae bacterium]
MPLIHETFFLSTLPMAADEAAARRGFERWAEAADPTMRDFAADAKGRQILGCLFGNSPFLTQCCLLDPPFLMRLVNEGWASTFAALLHELHAALDPKADRALLMEEMRLLKRRTALTVALADIAGLASLETVTRSLSDFADGALALSVRHLLASAAREGEIVLQNEDPARGSGFIVLAMGKLGGRELNYSSD